MNTAQNLITNADSQAHPDLLNLKLRDGGVGGGHQWPGVIATAPGRGFLGSYFFDM